MLSSFGLPAGGNFRDIIKYDGRSAHLSRVDKDRVTGTTALTDITCSTFALDFGSFEVGFVAFTPNGPVRTMVPYGQQLPPQPQDKDQDGKLISKPGFFALVAGQSLGGIREWCSNANVLLTGLAELWEMFAASPQAISGQIPLVTISGSVPVTNARSTNYKPTFRIVNWVDRLPDMGPRTVPPPSGILPAAAPATTSPPSPPPQPQPAATKLPADAMPW